VVVKVKMPEVVGVPEIDPYDGASVRPVGIEPAEIE
jgi:hypothetical protein